MAIPMHYATSYEWTGEHEDGALRAEGKAEIVVGGAETAGRWSPEHLLLGAAEICLVNTFISIARLSKLPFASWKSTAEGEIEFVQREGYRFKRIVVRPTVVVAEKDVEKAKDVMERAHRFCLISRSLNCSVDVEPTFSTA